MGTIGTGHQSDSITPIDFFHIHFLAYGSIRIESMWAICVAILIIILLIVLNISMVCIPSSQVKQRKKRSLTDLKSVPYCPKLPVDETPVVQLDSIYGISDGKESPKTIDTEEIALAKINNAYAKQYYAEPSMEMGIRSVETRTHHKSTLPTRAIDYSETFREPMQNYSGRSGCSSDY